MEKIVTSAFVQERVQEPVRRLERALGFPESNSFPRSNTGRSQKYRLRKVFGLKNWFLHEKSQVRALTPSERAVLARACRILAPR